MINSSPRHRASSFITILLTAAIGASAMAARPGAPATPPLSIAGDVLGEVPWRVFLVCSQQEKHRRAAVVTYTPAPPAGWAGDDFDDSAWGRYGSDLSANIGGYGFGQGASSTLLCLRTRFGVTDPATAGDLSLSLEYRGGVVVYVNGQEVARQHLPKGKIEPQTPADEYPAEAFTDAAGAQLAQADRPAEENRDRYEKRIRTLSIPLPPSMLRKGANSLALELHAAPPGKMQIGGRTEWSTVGLCDVRLISKTGRGVSRSADALAAITVSNATPMDTIAVTPGKRQAGFLWWGVTITPVGLTGGNPFESVRAIRAAAPRGGTCSGQVVVRGPAAITGLKATLSPLQNAQGGAALPPQAVRIAYATQEKDEVFCNALMPSPVDGAAVQPVWIVVDVPRNQAPGWYTGTLTLAVGQQKTLVPVQIFVAGWTLTDPKDNATMVSMYQSPDTLAEHFKVEPWSDRHFALIEKSLESMALMGNDVLLVPVVIDNYLNHKTGLIRWVRKADGYEPEFSAFERYLDLQTKVFGRPKVVTLSVWKHDFGTRAWFRGMKSDTVKPCMVTQLDPRTGKMQPLQAPHFGQPGSEAFWKTMIQGARKIVKARGIDDRFLLLGEAFDSRPLEAHRKFFEQIEPGMRWQVYAHFDGGEPPPKDGKFICHGGFEVGFRINPNGGCLPEFDRNWPKVTPNEFLIAQAERTAIHYTSSPLSYRVVMRASGTIARIGLDFWPIMTDERGRRRSYYGCPPNEGWLWRGHVPTLTAPGPDSAVRTSRGQMILEGLQEAELIVALTRAKLKAAPEMAARIERYLAEWRQADFVGKTLPQAMISLDLGGLAARGYALAAELAGQPGQGDWQSPPQGAQP